MKIVLSETRAISETSPASFTVQDAVEGDVLFTFRLVQREEDGNQSYTRYVVKDSHHGEIQISNVPTTKSVRLSESMRVGTYMNTSKLYLTFSLTEVLEGGYRNINVRFFTDKED